MKPWKVLITDTFNRFDLVDISKISLKADYNLVIKICSKFVCLFHWQHHCIPKHAITKSSIYLKCNWKYLIKYGYGFQHINILTKEWDIEYGLHWIWSMIFLLASLVSPYREYCWHSTILLLVFHCLFHEHLISYYWQILYVWL